MQATLIIFAKTLFINICYLMIIHFLGWGTTRSGGYSSDVLKFASLEIVDNRNCSEQYKEGGFAITENMICAQKPDTDTCQGDSGGPLICLQGTFFNALKLANLIMIGN